MEMEKLRRVFRSEPVPLFPGIALFYLSYAEGPPAVCHEAAGQVLQISYCKSGRLAWEMEGGDQVVLNPGNVSLHAMSACAGPAPALPTGRYQGLAICVDPQEASLRPPELLKDMDIFPDLLREKFCPGGAAALLAGDERTEGIFSGFYGQPERLRLASQRVKTLELFLYLAGVEFAPRGQTAGYQREQIETVREVHDWLLRHMEQRITIEELARQYTMNPTTLKAVFKLVYGRSLAAHIKEHRMEQAAKLLRETDSSVAEIAQAVGYDSPSRFTAAFKASYRVLPREYRRDPGSRGGPEGSPAPPGPHAAFCAWDREGRRSRDPENP